MEIIKELLPGCFLIQPKKIEDQRGYFIKTYHEELSALLGINLEIAEEFLSSSHKHVLRGMHFQLPPHDHQKLVYCTQGAVLDVLLDLRKGDGYGKTASVQISKENNQLIFIPKGVAHGFLALTNDALMVYKTSTVHTLASDSGIKWDSFGFDWGIDVPITSLRDQAHGSFIDFLSPF